MATDAYLALARRSLDRGVLNPLRARGSPSRHEVSSEVALAGDEVQPSIRMPSGSSNSTDRYPAPTARPSGGWTTVAPIATRCVVQRVRVLARAAEAHVVQPDPPLDERPAVLRGRRADRQIPVRPPMA